MTPYGRDARRREEEYADSPRRRDDWEPVYPDGTPKHECWNSTALRPQTPPRKPAPPEKEEEP